MQKTTAYLRGAKPITGKSTWEEGQHILMAVSELSRWRGGLLGLGHLALSVCSTQLGCMSKPSAGLTQRAAAASFPLDTPGGCSVASVFAGSSSPVGLGPR